MDELIHLPPEILNNPKAAVIIPPFFFPEYVGISCGTLPACLKKLCFQRI